MPPSAHLPIGVTGSTRLASQLTECREDPRLLLPILAKRGRAGIYRDAAPSLRSGQDMAWLLEGFNRCGGPSGVTITASTPALLHQCGKLSITAQAAHFGPAVAETRVRRPAPTSR